MQEKEITRIQELIYELRVSDVMTKGIIKVSPTTPMDKLREIFRDNRISGVPVVRGRQLVGIVSLEDFIKWLTNGGPGCVLEEWMTRNVITVYDNEPLIQAVNKLEKLKFGRLPVLRRETGELTGVITKGDILAGLLRKLDIGYRQMEMRKSRSGYIFKDVVADKSVINLEYKVIGGNFDRAGTAASGLKNALIRFGIPPPKARRAAIAAYEAEMNIVFFTKGGKIITKIDPDLIRLEIEDDGPGIPDIEKAMQPGFSTAPDWVRELGFGAGMGLHNIQNCADRMDLTSSVNKGTRLEVDILLEVEDESGRDRTKAPA